MEAKSKKHICILIHGFSFKKNSPSLTDNLIPFLENYGFTVDAVNYHYKNRLHANRHNKELAEYVKDRIREYKLAGHKVCVVSYSNGCTIAHLASKQASSLEAPELNVYISPALRTSTELGKHVRACLIYYSPYDKPLQHCRGS